MPNPPPFTLPPSTIPTSNMYPYNKLNQPQAQNPPASAGSSSVPTKPPSTAPPPKSPEVRSTQPTSSSGTARPFGAAGTEISELERQRRSAENKYPYTARPSSTESHTPAASHAPHHHHHHHHHHTHSTAPTSSATPTPPTSSTASTAQPPRRDALGYAGGRFGGYGLFGGFRDIERERQQREKLEKERQEKERLEKEKKPPTSPVARTSASPFARPGQPTSPTAARTTPNPNPAKPTSPKATTTQTGRPNLPMPGYGSMGSRALPSPFDRDRSTSNSVDPPAAHHRTGSSSSNRDAVPSTSPKTATAQPAGRNSFSGTQPAPSRSPSAPGKPNPAPAAKAPYSAYSSYQPPYMGYGSGFSGYGGFGGSWVERERAKAKEREMARETERLIQVQAEKRKQEAARTADPYRPPSATPSRIEVLNTPEAPQTAYPAGSDAASQAVPSREPRPYTYSAKPEQAPTPAKDYTYQPRDKRPRMDAAVDDARRGASKAKRRKDDDKASPTGTRDLTALTKEVRKWPEVRSRQVENWLTNHPEWQRVLKTAGRDLYQGSDWTLAQGQLTQTHNEGMKVFVRINAAFLGPSWVVRGEKGWDDAVPHPPMGVELGRGLERRGIWGTDVYTDDSDLGLVLIHAGWIRWMETGDSMDKDVIEVKVRVVPKLVRYFATERNGVRTRSWGNGHDGASIVVEGVKRVTMTPKVMKGKRNRKLVLAELAQQRKLVFGSPLEDDHRILNGIQRPVVFTQMGAALKYHPDALAGCFDIKSTDENQYNLLTHDLEFISGKDHYLLHSVNNEDPIQLDLKQYRSTEPVRTFILAEYIVHTDMHLTPEGIAVELKDGKGLFIKVEGFVWKLPPAQSVFSDPGTIYSESE